MSRFVEKYELSFPYGNPVHTWTVVGARMAVHLHVSDHGEEHAKEYGDRFSGGIEIHFRRPPDYMTHDAPSQKECWLIGGPCWHDGSSLQASERWIPLWLTSPDDHAGMLRMLRLELIERDGGYPEEDR